MMDYLSKVARVEGLTATRTVKEVVRFILWFFDCGDAAIARGTLPQLAVIPECCRPRRRINPFITLTERPVNVVMAVYGDVNPPLR
jgi:hypothetical protein